VSVGVTLISNANAWIVTYNGSTGSALPFDLWPGATEPNRSKPWLPSRVVWMAGDLAVAGNKVIIQDNAGNDFIKFIATGADYEPPQEWKRGRKESAPIGAIITQFDAGELFIYGP
jgi:hypothetical protein